ncbi:MAG: rompA [Rickettsiaceae bacterium]|jgi:outer membrane autotransporter protein|nr:rompA [Rickettsiaceae bacterium]
MKKKFIIASALSATFMTSSANAIIRVEYYPSTNSGGIAFNKALLNAENPVTFAASPEAIDLRINSTDFINFRNNFNQSNLNVFGLSFNGDNFIRMAADSDSLSINSENKNAVKVRINDERLSLNAAEFQSFLEESGLDENFTSEDNVENLKKIKFSNLSNSLNNANEIAKDIKNGTFVTTAQNSSIIINNMADQLDTVADLISDRVEGATVTTSTGQAAGDSFGSLGAWAKVFGAQAKQKHSQKYTGFKSNEAGATIGFDTELSDEITLGFAYSYVDGKVKVGRHRTKTKSHIGTIYSKAMLTDTTFTNVQLSGGKSNIKIGKAKTKANLLGTKLELGNNFDIGSSMFLVPTVGLRYDQIHTKAYARTSATKLKRTAGDLGIALKHVTTGENFTIIPEVHAKVLHTFSGKAKGGKIISVNHNAAAAIPVKKTPKNTYVLGGSLNFVQTKTAEFGVGYDYSFRPKFKAHSGFVKARISF